MTKKADLVLVTGISGYIAKHVAHGLLLRGYKVRGTVRELAKGEQVKADLIQTGVDVSGLSFVETDLQSDAGWEDAVKGCAYIQHLASPLPLRQPEDREALVPEARAGAQRVLSAGFAAGVKRIVMTSSIAAMIGQPGKGAHLKIKQDSWTDPDWKKLTAYSVSKTRAEISAWEYAKVQGFEDRLTVINPGFVLGPAIGTSYGTSLGLIEQMFAGEFPRTPKAAYPVVDVRDLADLHIAAMKIKGAAGRRLVGAGETLWFSDIANIARAAYPEKGRKLPKGELPNFVVRIAAKFDNRISAIVADLGTFHEADTQYVTDLTGVSFRQAKQSVLDSCAYLAELGKI